MDNLTANAPLNAEPKGSLARAGSNFLESMFSKKRDYFPLHAVDSSQYVTIDGFPTVLSSKDHLTGDQEEDSARRGSHGSIAQPTCCEKTVKVSSIVLLLTVIVGLLIYFFDPNIGTDIWRSRPGADGDNEDDTIEYRAYPGAETEFLQIPNADKAKEWLSYYTSAPHIAGSKSDFDQAVWTRDKFLELGIPEAEIQTYYPLLNIPLQKSVQSVSIVEPVEIQVSFDLREPVIDEDPTSIKYRDAVPAFHGYSANGNVTGKLVYVNYGRREDFDILKSKGIDFEGTIALVRYGTNFRGLKVRAAEMNGCAGVIIYSDPRDDGSLKGPVYPSGPWRPDGSYQRGSVHYSSLYPGDPLTPGRPAHKGAHRVSQKKALTLPKIPSIPISYRDAKVLLDSIGQSGEPASIFSVDASEDVVENSVFTGPGDVVVNLNNFNDYKVTPIWNVIGRIRGSEEPDKVVYLGNHRDAWVTGAVDPSSGSACMIEVARGLGTLLKNGWKPRRTIVLASWDGEEYGMVGSTEFVEDESAKLLENGIAYLNVDISTSGPHLFVAGTPSLSQLLRNVSHALTDPHTGKSLYAAWLDDQLMAIPDGKDQSTVFGKSALPFVGQLGSGSDFVSFVDYVGMASANLGYKGDYGVYHSNYDSFHWMEKFGDPGFRYHETMAKYWGLIALRLSDSAILPFNYTEYAYELDAYVEHIEKTTMTMRIPLQFPLLHRIIGELLIVSERTAMEITEERNRNTESTGDGMSIETNIKRRRSLNYRLQMAEREFLDPKGLPGRPWYKHVVFAPGLWAGYGATTFPTLTEAVETFKNTKEDASTIDTVKQIEIDLAYRIKRVALVLAGLDIKQIEKDHDILEFPV